MSLSTQTQKRLPTIKQGLLTGLNYENIGRKCGVTERTIDRDISNWVDSGQFETWIKEEWMRLHNIIVHEDPVEAYRQITKLVRRMVTQKVEAKEEIIEMKAIHVDISVFSDDEKSILDKAARILDGKSKGESTSIH